MELFYTYTLSYPDGRVFYVGKGKGSRIYAHEREARSGKNSYKCNVIRKIWRVGGEVIKEKVLETPVEKDALLYEWVLINLIYGRENLTNKTDGGEGVVGIAYSQEYKDNMSRVKKGAAYYKSDAFRAKMKEVAAKREYKPLTDEQRKAFGDHSRGSTWPAHRYRIARKEGKGKIWPGFISPDGSVYRDIRNLTTFCEEHGLCAASMWKIGHGKQEQYKGWRSVLPFNPENQYHKRKSGRPRKNSTAA